MRLAFTGTRHGITQGQRNKLLLAISDQTRGIRPEVVAVHGCCMGADIDFHMLCMMVGIQQYDIWPSNDRSTNRVAEVRRICAEKEELGYSFITQFHPENKPLLRNEDIIRGADFLLACPREGEEIRRSGAWSTIRLARRYGVPMEIIFP